MEKDAARASHLDEPPQAGKTRRQSERRPLARRLVEEFSHDFRTPLTVIREFAEIMREGLGGPITDQQREYLATIVSRTDDLSLAVDDLLDASALQTGTLVLWRRAVQASEIIEHVRAAVASRLQARGVALETAVDDGLPAVYCDVNKTVRAIVNLASRTLKLSPAGGRIRISATRQDCGREVALKIADASAGASAANPAAMGKPSRRFGGATMKSVAGDADLEMQIARELVRINLGSVLVQRQEAGRREVTIALPAAEPLLLFERYLEFVQGAAEGTPRGPASISLMMAEIGAGAEEKLLSAADGFLQTAVGGGELVCRLDPRHWISAVRRQPWRLGRLLERIERKWKELGGNAPAISLPELQLEAIGSWRVDFERDALVRAFAAMVGPCVGPRASESG